MKIEDVKIGQFVIARGNWQESRGHAYCQVYPSKRKADAVGRYFMITSVDPSDSTVWLDGAGWWPIESAEPLTAAQVRDKINDFESEASRLKYALEHPVTEDQGWAACLRQPA